MHFAEGITVYSLHKVVGAFVYAHRLVRHLRGDLWETQEMGVFLFDHSRFEFPDSYSDGNRIKVFIASDWLNFATLDDALDVAKSRLTAEIRVLEQALNEIEAVKMKATGVPASR